MFYAIRMTYLTVVLSHLNPFSTIGTGFLKLWIQKYCETSEKTLRKKYYRFILLFISVFVIRISRVLTINQYDDRILIYLGSFAPLLRGPLKYYEFLFLLWSLNFIEFYFFLLNCNRNQYSWLELFRFLDSHRNCEINDGIITRSTFKVVTFKISDSFESTLFYKFKSCLSFCNQFQVIINHRFICF
jgi:hypothetical protein